jgi:hypothetical protein
MRTYAFVVIVLAILCGCRTEQIALTEEVIRGEIEAWWGARIFEGIVIEDTAALNRTYEVTARMVVCFDTLEAMKYEFKQYRKGWRIFKGPVDARTKREMIEEMLAIPLNTAKNNIVMSNMKELQRALNQFASESGRYPASFTVKDYSYSVKELLGPHTRNPYIPGAPGVIMARGDTSEWLSEYEGKAIYFPLDVDFEGKYASGYLIKGSSDRRFLGCVFRSYAGD